MSASTTHDADRVTEALAAAAQPSLAALALDERRAPAKLRPLFRSMGEMLFKEHLSLEKIRADAGVPDDGTIWPLFSEAVGQPAWRYLREARLEKAARLLVWTSLTVSEVGALVGYPVASAFRKAFGKFAGASPGRYRRRARKVLRAAGPPPRDLDDQSYWERALEGELSDEEVRELDDYLAGYDPAAVSPASSEMLPWIRMRAEMAAALTGALDHLDWSEQRQLVRDATWFPDAAFFNVLSIRSLDVGAEDPRRGVELALLAIDSLASNRLLGIEPGVAVLGWTRVARARWLAGDLPETEDALKQVARDLERLPQEDRDARIESERGRLLAAWKWFRGRPRKALELAEYAVRQERAAGLGLLGRTLLLRAELRASVDPGGGPSRRSKALRGALEDLEEALGLLDERCEWEHSYLFDLWMVTLVRLGDRAEMARVLPRVRRLAEQLGDGAVPRLRWFEGWAVRGADEPGPEDLWRPAREAFHEAGDGLWEARVTVDLLKHQLEHERVDEALRLAKALAALLGATAESSETLALVEALRLAGTAEQLAPGVLRAVELALRQLDGDLRARRAVRFVGK